MLWDAVKVMLREKYTALNESIIKETPNMHMDGWGPLLSTWTYHNIVNHLYPNTK